MKEIPLTGPCGLGKVTLVDDADFEYLSRWTWQFNNRGYVNREGKVYLKDGSGLYLRKTIILHRDILNAPKGMVVDHIDHNPLNNQRSNLRLCTPKQNLRHRQKMRTRLGQSQFIGVVYSDRKKRRKRWMPVVITGGKRFTFGYFATERQAAIARDMWALDLHGEFVATNFKPMLYGP